jgi:hypothetical protein
MVIQTQEKNLKLRLLSWIEQVEKHPENENIFSRSLVNGGGNSKGNLERSKGLKIKQFLEFA